MLETKLGSPAGPFQNTAPKYDYWSTIHSLAVERLAFAVGSSILLTVFTGAAGSGKSTVVRKVVSDAQSNSLIGACSYGPPINVDPCRAILEAFGADPGPGDKAAHRRILQQSLEAARYDFDLPTFVLDDAHQFKDAQFSNLFELAGLNEGPQNALFKIILVGNPDLLARLTEKSSELLGPSFDLEAMSEKDTIGYIKHRLKAADIANVPFDEGALGAIHERTGGNPQQINLLCKALLDEAAALEISQIDSKWVRECKTASVPEFKFEPELSMPTEPVSTPEVTPQKSKPAKPPRKKPPSTKPQETLVAKTKSQATAKRPPEAKPPKAPTSSDANESPPSFKSNRSPKEETKAKVKTDLPSVSRAAKPQTKPMGEPARPEKAAVVKSDSAPAPATTDKPKRGALARIAMLAGLAAAGGLAYVIYDPTSLPDRSDDAAIVTTETETSTVADPAIVAVDKETNGVSASTDMHEMTAPSIDEDSGTGFANTVAQPTAPPLDLTDTAPILAILDAFGAAPEGITEWYHLGLTVADQNPRAAVAAYALAAHHGHPRAAYFLAQMYELGEGVPVDTVLARIWYQKAGQQIEAAAERLVALPEPQAQETPGTPIQLVSFVTNDQEALMVWTSGHGADPAAYSVEFGDVSGAVVDTIEEVAMSVLRHTPPETAVYWRVRAHAEDTASSATSGWLLLDVLKQPANHSASADP